ncbi:MAG: hypothetical protein LBC56_00465 [Oscillospiraceae bacterium]|nr:hypothetical protein [Oscillospiraceae bacterium]
MAAHVKAIEACLESREQAMVELNGGNFDRNIMQLQFEKEQMRGLEIQEG